MPSLEEALAANTAVVTRNTACLEEMIAIAKGAKGAKAETAAEKKAREKAEAEAAGATTTTAAATTTAATSGVDLSAIKPALGEWLGEFAKEADKDKPEGIHPEVVARKATFRAVLDKLSVKVLTDITNPDDVTRLSKWLEKQKAIGRLAPDPKPAAPADDDL